MTAPNALWIVLLVLEGGIVCFIRVLRLMEIELGADVVRRLYERRDETIYFRGFLERCEPL